MLDLAFQQGDHLLGNRQPEAASSKMTGRRIIDLFKGFKNGGLLRFGNTDAFILHLNYNGLPCLPGTKMDFFQGGVNFMALSVKFIKI